MRGLRALRLALLEKPGWLPFWALAHLDPIWSLFASPFWGLGPLGTDLGLFATRFVRAGYAHLRLAHLEKSGWPAWPELFPILSQLVPQCSPSVSTMFPKCFPLFLSRFRNVSPSFP